LWLEEEPPKSFRQQKGKARTTAPLPQHEDAEGRVVSCGLVEKAILLHTPFRHPKDDDLARSII
jgi:hypothetical protein